VIEIYKKYEGTLQKLTAIEDGCWVNIAPPLDNNEIEHLGKELGIPLDFFSDSIDIDEQSRFEREDDVDLVVLNVPVFKQDESEEDAHYITAPIGVISVKGIIITISAYKNPILDFFLKRNVKAFDPSNHGDFLLRLFDKTIHYFLLYLKKINHERNAYQKELYNSSRNTELAKMLNLQKSLVYFSTSLRDNEQLIEKIKRTDFIKIRQNEEASDFLEDILIDNKQAREMTDIYTNILNGTMDAFASIISNNLNQVMKRLTSVTIVLMVPTLVASFFGMNVDLPFEKYPHAFPMTIGFSILLSFIVVYIFRKNKLF